jgi:putative acetyltransferase
VPSVVLRPYRNDDVEAAVSLWLRAWDAAMPEIDFGARSGWWRKRWVEELVPKNSIVVAEMNGEIAGFIVIDRQSGYLDQIAVRPESWGSDVAKTLLGEAKRLAVSVTLDVNQSNPRAIRFYEREGFVRTGEGVNPFSGLPTWRYAWKP